MRPVLARAVLGAIAVGLGGGLVAAGAAPSAAHVGITPSTTEAGATAVLELSVPHGCDGAPTTRLSVQVPTGVLGVVPTRNPMWDVETEVAEFTQPVTDAHGNEVTERVTSVTWTARQPLPDGVDDELAMSMQLPAEEGTQLWFPVVQQCRGAESAWIEVAEGEVDPADLEMPAPTFVVTEAAGDGDAHGAHGGGDADPASLDAPDAADETDGDRQAAGAPVLGIAGLALGLLGAVLGGTALVRQRRGA